VPGLTVAALGDFRFAAFDALGMKVWSDGLVAGVIHGFTTTVLIIPGWSASVKCAARKVSAIGDAFFKT
jgi:hypothetical protein